MLQKAWAVGIKTLKAWWPFSDDETSTASAVTPGLGGEGSLAVAVSVPATRTWQRKWREVKSAYGELAAMYNGNVLDRDEFTRAVETFFKICHEVGDWVQRQTHLPAMNHVRTAPTLRLCDAISNTGKHYSRQPTRRNPDPITATVGDPSGDGTGIRADIKWTSKSYNGTDDALRLADQCIREWEQFFQQHGLDPNS